MSMVSLGRARARTHTRTGGGKPQEGDLPSVETTVALLLLRGRRRLLLVVHLARRSVY